jgi:hypothetical protein
MENKEILYRKNEDSEEKIVPKPTEREKIVKRAHPS